MVPMAELTLSQNMLHLPELAAVGTRGFARGTEGGAATLPAWSIYSDRAANGPTCSANVGLKHLNLKPKSAGIPREASKGQTGSSHTGDPGLSPTDSD